jgi:hypothetical protein
VLWQHVFQVVVCVLSAVQRATAVARCTVFVGKKYFDVIKMDGTTIKIIREHIPSNYWYSYLSSRLHGVTRQKTVM